MTTITKTLFDKLPDGREVHAYRFEDGNASATVLSYGGILQSIVVPDKDGNPTDVLLGYDNIAGYINNDGYIGALIGRFGNRIEKGRFVIDGVEYNLYNNDRGNHLHGGKEGFDSKIWDVTIDGDRLVLRYLSKDGEENYPGNLDVTVVYTFRNQTLTIDYTAVSDKKTVINLTNHAYFNMNGAGSGSILDHTLYFDAPYITPTDENLIPHGQFRPVENTYFDFTKPTTLRKGDEHKEEDIDLKQGGGYDHCFVLREGRDQTTPCCTLVGDKSGIVMDCYTDLPAIQLYAGNGLNQDGKGGHYGRCGALCLETEDIPNNVNVPAYAKYGSSIYEAGKVYHTVTSYAFSTKK